MDIFVNFYDYKTKDNYGGGAFDILPRKGDKIEINYRETDQYFTFDFEIDESRVRNVTKRYEVVDILFLANSSERNIGNLNYINIFVKRI